MGFVVRSEFRGLGGLRWGSSTAARYRVVPGGRTRGSTIIIGPRRAGHAPVGVTRYRGSNGDGRPGRRAAPRPDRPGCRWPALRRIVTAAPAAGGTPGEIRRRLPLTGDARYPPLTCTAPAGGDLVKSRAAAWVPLPNTFSQRSET
jgi:hypothetical protein